MRLASYQLNDSRSIAVAIGDALFDLPLAYALLRPHDPPLPDEMLALLMQGPERLEQLRAVVTSLQAGDFEPQIAPLPQSELLFLPPVLGPQKVIAVGKNYHEHALEIGTAAPDFPLLFHKTAGPLIGHNQPIVIPPISNQIDFEGELAVIIGRRCRLVDESRALEYVAGYTIANDVTARDLQRRTSQFTQGKMCDTFAPLGPVLVTADEIADPQSLQIETRLNGETMQQDNTAKMIFSVAHLISYIAQFATLLPGDVILTGTPSGVGVARTPPRFLQAGDVISVRVDGIGELSNPVIDWSEIKQKET